MDLKDDQYIDIHSHKDNYDASVLSLRSLLISELNILPESANQLYSAGIHPWFISSESLEKDLTLLKKTIEKPEFIALGEAGIDKTLKTSLSVQADVFSKQVSISDLAKKPMIIHCVKAYSELISKRKKGNCKNPWLFHNFRGNLLIANELINLNCYLSFGNLLSENKQLQQLFIAIPSDRIFFETDEALVDIAEIYNFAASLIGKSIKSLKKQIIENFYQCFNTK